MVVDVFNVVQFIFPVDYICPIAIWGFVPPCNSPDFLWEVVFQPRLEMGIFSFLVQV